MYTKEKLLELLEANRGTWISGEEVAESLSLTRASIWKAVRSLREDGYIIEAVRKKGYRLSAETDILSELGVLQYLDPACGKAIDIHVMQEVSSTNALLREKAFAGSPEGTVLIATMQTAGKGRLGRSFYSPADSGVYMSLLLRPSDMEPEQAVRLTTIAAVAACEAIEAESGKTARIKWVNDIYVENRKVCGILTEGMLSMETGRMDSVVLGLGINVYEPDGGFPEEIRNLAGAIFEARQQDGKNRLVAGFLNRFMKRYLAGDYSGYIDEYRKRSIAIGREVTVKSGNSSRKAFAKDVDDECRLVVEYEDGLTEHLTGGEISISL